MFLFFLLYLLRYTNSVNMCLMICVFISFCVIAWGLGLALEGTSVLIIIMTHEVSPTNNQMQR
jgi:hypothetical protein